ncbi:MAG: hypothetical protein RLZZ546_2665 [Bacteroidota bacterium]
MQHLYWKQIIASCLLISLSLNGFGQNGGVNQPDHDYEKFWAGLYAGFLSSNHQYTRGNNFLTSSTIKEIYSEPAISFHGGIPITFRVYKNILLRSGLSIILNNDINNKYKTTDNKYFKTSPIFFQVPVAIKYESDRYDFLKYRDALRHYIFVGATLNYDFSTGSVYYYSPTTSTTLDEAILKKTNLTYDLGLGLTFTINDYVRISPELKFSYGINNLIKPGANNSPLLNLDKLTTNYISFSLHIEN